MTSIYTGHSLGKQHFKASKIAAERRLISADHIMARLFGPLKSVNPCGIEIWVKVFVFPEN